MSQPKINQDLIDLWEAYVHAHCDRGIFLDKASRLLGNASAAAAIIPLLQSNYANAVTIPENDERLFVERLRIDSAHGPMSGYLVRPKIGGPHGGVLVIHQNRGLNPHIEDIARRLAVEEFVALAVDFLSPSGGTPKDEEEAIKRTRHIDLDAATADAGAMLAYLHARGEVAERVGAIGFCWGGSIVNRLAASSDLLNAAVVYYGAPPPLERVARIRAPLLLNYADPALDKWLGPLLPDYENSLQTAGVRYALHLYTGANHGFHDDTQVVRYHRAAAELSWTRTLAFFKQHLG